MPRIPSVPRLPFVPDALRRVRVPRDLESVTTVGDEEDPAAAGMSDENVERIWEAAVSWYRAGVHPALQVCVRRNGRVVLDRAIGHARGNGPSDSADAEKELATPETPFLIYSGSKAVTAFVIHMLVDRGEIDLEDPVCRFIPGYERNGKGEIKVGHVLAHRAGVPNIPREAMDLDRIHDREFLVKNLCDAKPFAKPGRLLAYHAVSGGFILGRDPPAARLSLDELRRGGGGRGSRRPQLRDRGASPATPLDVSHPRARVSAQRTRRGHQ